MLGSIAEGITEIRGFLRASKPSTLNAFRAMGVSIEGPDKNRVRVVGVGRDGLQCPAMPLDLGNSGTLSAPAGGAVGRATVSHHPGRRRFPDAPAHAPGHEPLAQMGARIQTSSHATAPLRIEPALALKGIEYAMPVASARSSPACCWPASTPRGKPASSSRRRPGSIPNACWPPSAIQCAGTVPRSVLAAVGA